MIIALVGALALLITRPLNTDQTAKTGGDHTSNVETNNKPFPNGIETGVSLMIGSGDLTMDVGSHTTLTYTVTPPDYAARKSVAWGSDNPSVALLGVISATDGSVPLFASGEGTAAVTLVIGEGRETLTQTIIVTVVPEVTEPDTDSKKPDPEDKASPDDKVVDSSDTAANEPNRGNTAANEPDSTQGTATVPGTSGSGLGAAIPETTVPTPGGAAIPEAAAPGSGGAPAPEATAPGSGGAPASETTAPGSGGAPASETTAQVKGVTINGGNKVMRTGDSLTLRYTVTPPGYDVSKKIKWSTSNADATKLGSVSSSNGSVSIITLMEGTAIVTVTIGEGIEAVSNSITITVE
jgi:hypothetical protein